MSNQRGPLVNWLTPPERRVYFLAAGALYSPIAAAHNATAWEATGFLLYVGGVAGAVMALLAGVEVASQVHGRVVNRA